MPDDEMPYSGAIEETVKAAGKALDLIKDASGPIADAYGLIIGDRVHAARHRRLDAIMRKTKKILKDRDLSETAEVAEQIAIPLLEAAQREPREEMQDLWARLLANAMDPARRDDVRPEYIQALEKLHPIDAVILQKASEAFSGGFVPHAMADVLKIRPSSVNVSLDHLVDAKCVTRNQDLHKISSFGSELLLACQP